VARPVTVKKIGSARKVLLLERKNYLVEAKRCIQGSQPKELVPQTKRKNFC